MREKSLGKIVKTLPKGQITLPVEFRRRLHIDDRTFLSLTLKRGRIEIVPLRPVPQKEALRDYQQDEIERFLREDRIDAETASKVRRLLREKKRG
jgi:bifunctional DNA-binding transcriptional regulator/antitoxin component of YhaV-PrlF toxin-antitoxin module